MDAVLGFARKDVEIKADASSTLLTDLHIKFIETYLQNPLVRLFLSLINWELVSLKIGNLQY